MRCLFCLCPLKRYFLPHILIAVIQLSSAYKELTLLAQQQVLVPLTKHFQSDNKISKNLFYGKGIDLLSQPNCFSILTPYFSHRKSTAFRL